MQLRRNIFVNFPDRVPQTCGDHVRLIGHVINWVGSLLFMPPRSALSCFRHEGGYTQPRFRAVQLLLKQGRGRVLSIFSPHLPPIQTLIAWFSILSCQMWFANMRRKWWSLLWSLRSSVARISSWGIHLQATAIYIHDVWIFSLWLAYDWLFKKFIIQFTARRVPSCFPAR